MNALIPLPGGEFTHNLAMALLHTLWQAAVMATLLYAYLRAAPAEAAGKRYGASLAALIAIVLSGLLTLSILDCEPSVTASTVFPDTDNETVADTGPGQTDGNIIANVDHSERREGSGESLAPSTSRDWHVWAIGAWLTGVAVMLLRTLAIVLGGGRLRRRCRPVESETVLAMIERWRRHMHIGRPIRVVMGEHLSVPGVVGCLWPTLLLPVAMVSGVPADDLRAILAHELAHIRRFDYLVNFCQMVVEALLFFNPAVWWVSRQIRLEREACCDAAAVALTGQKTHYAETLVAWAQRMRQPPGAAAALVSFTDGNEESKLVDRIKRILIAGHRPRLRVSWPGALAMVVLSLLALAALWQGMDLAVEVAGKILTPAERIEKLSEMVERYGPGDRQYGEADYIQVSGTVRTYDGGPLPKRVTLMFGVNQPRQHFSIGGGAWPTSEGGATATFNDRVPYGQIYIIATGDGYASDFAGPFEPEPGGSIKGIELVLGQGFPAQIRVQDELGQPIEGAEIQGGYICPPNTSYHHTITVTTDSNGIAIVDNATEHPVGLQIEADGYELTRTSEILFQRDRVSIVTLQATAAVTGVVRSAETGEPLAGATIHILLAETEGHSYHGGGATSEPDAVTEENGRFALTRLRRDYDHLLLVQAKGHGCKYLSYVRAGDSDLIVALGPERLLRGTIIGDLDRLNRDEDGAPVIEYTGGYGLGHDGNVGEQRTSPVTVADGVGTFEIRNFLGQTVTLTAGDERVKVEVETDDLENVVIDLSPEKKREIILTFNVPADAPAIDGGVHIRYQEQGARASLPGRAEITDGRASCRLPVPCRFTYGVDYYQGKRPVGYWFREADPIEIPAGHEPFIIEVPLYPAGAICGQVLGPDGSVANDARIALLVAKTPGFVGSGLNDISNALAGSNLDRGRFNATPLPLGGKYALVANLGNYYHLTEALSLDEAHPVVETDIRLGRGITLTGSLLDADGTPARDPVQLGVSVHSGESGRSSQEAAIIPDENGAFAIENVNPDLDGKYFMHVNVRPGYRPVRHEIEDVRRPVALRLERAMRLTGIVLDDASGRPVPGAEVYAYASRNDSGAYQYEMLEAEAVTNERGEFVFSNMAAREYTLGIRSANLADPRSPVTGTGGQADPVTLRITIPDQSKLKPHRLSTN